MAPRSKRPAARASRATAARAAGRTGTGRRDELLTIAADLFATGGYASTTVRDIADAAGILSGSLYHHFSSKEEMADAILSGFLEEVLAQYDEIVAAREPVRETFAALVSATLLAMDRHQSAVVIYQNDGRQLAALERFAYLRDAGGRFEAAWTEVLQRGIDEGEFRRSLDVRLAYRLIRAALWTVASWYRSGGEYSASEIADHYVSMLLDGIARGRRKKGKG